MEDVSSNQSGLTLLMVMHVVVSILGLILSHVREKSIITDRLNKYIFFVISILYSLIVPPIVVHAFLELQSPFGISSTMYRLGTWGSLVAFTLIQTLVYRVLNYIEAE